MALHSDISRTTQNSIWARFFVADTSTSMSTRITQPSQRVLTIFSPILHSYGGERVSPEVIVSMPYIPTSIGLELVRLRDILRPGLSLSRKVYLSNSEEVSLKQDYLAYSQVVDTLRAKITNGPMPSTQQYHRLMSHLTQWWKAFDLRWQPTYWWDRGKRADETMSPLPWPDLLGASVQQAWQHTRSTTRASVHRSYF